MTPKCGVCEREAEVMATVPMCGERPRYPLCGQCFDDMAASGYLEDVTPLDNMLAALARVFGEST